MYDCYVYHVLETTELGIFVSKTFFEFILSVLVFSGFVAIVRKLSMWG